MKKVQISSKIVSLLAKEKAAWMKRHKEKRNDVDWDAGLKEAEEKLKVKKDGASGNSEKSATN